MLIFEFLDPDVLKLFLKHTNLVLLIIKFNYRIFINFDIILKLIKVSTIKLRDHCHSFHFFQQNS